MGWKDKFPAISHSYVNSLACNFFSNVLNFNDGKILKIAKIFMQWGRVKNAIFW